MTESQCLLCCLQFQGTDSEEGEYSSIRELWKKELKPIISSKSSDVKTELLDPREKFSKGLVWYQQAYDYWEDPEKCPISDDGVLGGYGKLTPVDVIGSNHFIDDLIIQNPLFQFHRAADCGAGIGRVTKFLLLPRFQQVDLVEQSPRLLESSTSYIGAEATRTSQILCGLQDFAPEPNTYDMIWIQWVIGHLHDLDFIDFFKRCSRGLKPNGYIVLKDNCAESWTFVVDKGDSSVARCVEYIRLLIDLAGCDIILEKLQLGFPTELYPVRMFAIQGRS